MAWTWAVGLGSLVNIEAATRGDVRPHSKRRGSIHDCRGPNRHRCLAARCSTTLRSGSLAVILANARRWQLLASMSTAVLQRAVRNSPTTSTDIVTQLRDQSEDSAEVTCVTRSGAQHMAPLTSTLAEPGGRDQGFLDSPILRPDHRRRGATSARLPSRPTGRQGRQVHSAGCLLVGQAAQGRGHQETLSFRSRSPACSAPASEWLRPMHGYPIAHAVVRTSWTPCPIVRQGSPPSGCASARCRASCRRAFTSLYDVAPRARASRVRCSRSRTCRSLSTARTCGHQELSGIRDFRCPRCGEPCGDVVAGKELEVADVTFDERATVIDQLRKGPGQERPVGRRFAGWFTVNGST